MGIKIQKNLKNLLKIPEKISKNFSREVKDDIEVEIIREIQKGNSPVRGHKFDDYSDAYAKRKGYAKPVDMTLSGDMLKSFYVKDKKKGSLEMGFDSEIAEYHQEGEGNMPQRKLLPTGKGDKFNTKLTKFINNALKKAVKKAIK